MKTVNELIKDINHLNSNLHDKDFLLTWEQSPDELKQVLDVAAALKTLRAENIATKVFNSGLGISVFRDNSTRTRFSYASALNLLGLAQQDLDEGKSQIAHGETVRETANMISFCADAIGIRDDMFLGAGNAYMREVGEALDDGEHQPQISLDQFPAGLLVPGLGTAQEFHGLLVFQHLQLCRVDARDLHLALHGCAPSNPETS